MAKKKREPEPVPPIPIPKQDLSTLDDIATALIKIKSRVEYRIQRNHNEARILERALFKIQMAIIELNLVNRQSVEPDPAN